MTDGAVSSLLVVDQDPPLTDGASLIKTFELISIQHFDTERAVESFDVRVLCWAPGLGELPFNTAGFGPCLHDVATKFRTVVATHDFGLAVPIAQLLQHTNNPFPGQAEIDLDRQDIACAIVDDIEGAIGASVDQGVAHEVHRPDLIGVQLLYQWLLHALRQTPATSPAQGQALFSIQSLRALVVDSMAFSPKLLVQLRATPSTVFIRQFDQPRLNQRVLLTSPQGPTLSTARLRHQAARAALAKLLVIHSPYHRLAALHRRQNFFVSASFSTA